MVRAILDGRKTQTRRVMKEKDVKTLDFFLGDDCTLDDLGFVNQDGKHRVYLAEYPEEGGADLSTPYGIPGDQLWVREAFAIAPDTGAIFYRTGKQGERAKQWGLKFKPSIHMPRFRSRITLEITNVRVERIWDISEGDIEAEGVSTYTHRTAFVDLWQSVNGKRPGCAWEDNPWVWVVEFKKI